MCECKSQIAKWSVTRSVVTGVGAGIYMAYAYKNGFSNQDVGQLLLMISLITGVDFTHAIVSSKKTED